MIYISLQADYILHLQNINLNVQINNLHVQKSYLHRQIKMLNPTLKQHLNVIRFYKIAVILKVQSHTFKANSVIYCLISLPHCGLRIVLHIVLIVPTVGDKTFPCIYWSLFILHGQRLWSVWYWQHFIGLWNI